MSDANVGCINDCGYRLNVLGGWYDAGDHGKYVVNGGISVWTLLDLYEHAKYLGHGDALLRDGALALPENANGVPDVLDEARWELDFLMKMQAAPTRACRIRPRTGSAAARRSVATWTTSTPGRSTKSPSTGTRR